jgi:hypothetical protein
MVTTLIPETAATLAAQLRWLEAGKRRAVLITPGAPLPHLREEWGTVNTSVGLFVYRISSITADDIALAVHNDDIGLVLDYGIARKPEQPTGAIVVRGADGHVKQGVLYDEATRDAVLAAARQVADPEDQIGEEDIGAVLGERLGLPRPAADAEAVLRRVTTPQEWAAVRKAAHDDGDAMGFPSHAVWKGGQIIGGIGIHTTPVVTVWIARDTPPRQTRELVRQIETLCRDRQPGYMVVPVRPESPFLPAMEKLGYQASGSFTMFIKKL